MIFEAIMKSVTVGEFIVETQNTFPGSSGELSKILSAIKLASKIVSHHINKAGLANLYPTTKRIAARQPSGIIFKKFGIKTTHINNRIP